MRSTCFESLSIFFLVVLTNYQEKLLRLLVLSDLPLYYYFTEL